jgi:hypothetical protein
MTAHAHAHGHGHGHGQEYEYVNEEAPLDYRVSSTALTVCRHQVPEPSVADPEPLDALPGHAVRASSHTPFVHASAIPPVHDP